MISEEKIMNILSKVMHPAINLNLVDLGIVSKAKAENDKIEVEMAFPILTIPIKDVLLDSVRQALSEFGEVDFQIREMTEKEKQNFVQLEGQNWKGL